MYLFASIGFVDTLERLEDVVAFVWFVIERGAPVFELLIAVLIVLSIVRYVAPETLAESSIVRAQALSRLFPPTRDPDRDADDEASLLPEHRADPNPAEVRYAGVGASSADRLGNRSADAANVG